MTTNKKNKKIIVLILVITFAFSPFLATTVQAQWVVWDPGNFVPNSMTAVNTTVVSANTTAQTTKDFGLDAVAWVIAKLIIQRIVASTVNWINSGFNGSPSFVTNPEAFFGNIGDQIAGQFIFSNPNLNFLCGSISAKIKLALTNNYIGDNTRWQCTLTQVGKNVDNFMSSFDNGGWDSFFELTQKTQNNPIGAYMQAQNEMYMQIGTAQNQKKQELLQGNGFLSYQKCKSGTETAPLDSNGRSQCDTSYNTCLKAGTGDRAAICSEAYSTCQKTYAGVAPGDCKGSDKETVTPGSVISNQLNKALDTGTDSLVTADEINEIVSALLNQLVSKALGGLRDLSSPSPTTGQTFTSQLNSSTAAGTTDYFGNQQNTQILDVPIPGADTTGQTSTTYNTDQLMNSADSLTYTTGVTEAQMQAINDWWSAKLAQGTVTSIAPNSVLAYMLGWGGLPEGTVKTTSGMTYTLTGGTWVKQN